MKTNKAVSIGVHDISSVLAVGDRCKALFDGSASNDLYDGTVTKVDPKSSRDGVTSYIYSIRYDDGDTDTNLPGVFVLPRPIEEEADAVRGSSGW